MKFKILISILAIVLVAGCTIPGIELPTGTSFMGGSGLEITEFTAEPNPVYSGSRVRVTMSIQNSGGSTVNTSKGLVYLTGSNVQLGCTGTSCNLYWIANDGKDETQPLTREMKPADVVKGTSADLATFTWSVTAPSVTAGQTRTDTFYGRTYCDYSTGVNGNIWVYTEGEADAAKASGRAINKASFTSTSGPVGLGVTVSPDPVILYTGGDKTFSLYIKIKNLATGTIYRYNKLNYASNNVTIDSADYNQVYIDLSYDTTALKNTTSCIGDQELPANKETTLVCEFNITDPSSITLKSYPISITAKYGYYTERVATVTVQGK